MKILITGASKGIGEAEAIKLDNLGHELFLTASKTQSFGNNFSKHHLYGADLNSSEDAYKLAQVIKNDTESIDVLIHNVGIVVMKKFEDMTSEDIDRLLNVNLKSPLLLTKELLPLLQKGNNPTIIFMSSMAAKSSVIGESVYSSTKAGITSFASVLRNELAGKVKVSTIHSWGVNTFGATEEEQQNAILKPDRIVEVVEFIITRGNDFVIESIEVGAMNQWRGSRATWSPA